jgi:GNAT superfamily N-acetyltransferase
VDASELRYSLLTEKNWDDLEKLFGPRGACGGCWCMTWRLKPKEFDLNKGEGNRKLLREIITRGKSPGILAYYKEEPAGWCAFAPREEYVKLENSRVLKKIDEEKVISVTCFFIKKEFRHKGLSTLLLKEVIQYARQQNIKVVEGYPVTPYKSDMPSAFAWTGLPSAFYKAGFISAAERGKRKIMRFYLK